MLICPVCKEDILKNNKTYKCSNNHSFDIHKSGYVNLLLSNRMNSKLPGDNKLMVEARRSFLKKGYYSSLLFALNEIIDGLNPASVLDLGCGEGYYTDGIYKENRLIFGVDISKTALAYAARENKNITYAVGSVFNLPIKDESVSLIISLFAPYSGDEFLRVLNKSGHLIMVIPAREHLFELKSAIYESPYENVPKDYTLSGFEFENKTVIKEKITITDKIDIDNLFKMTPYYYKTKKEDYDKIKELDFLETTINFEILKYRNIKIGNC